MLGTHTMGSDSFRPPLVLSAVAIASVTVSIVIAGPIAVAGQVAEEVPGGTVGVHNFLGSPIEQTVEFLRSQDPERTGVFFGSCRIVNSDRSPENYVLVVPRSGHSAYLAVTIENDGRQITANMATLSLAANSVAIEEALGGVWTYRRLQRIATELLTRDFRFTFDYTVAFHKLPTQSCAPSE
jgi:hypothetical protein